MKFRFNGHLLFLIVSEMSPRIAACGLLLAHLRIALVLFCNHLHLRIWYYYNTIYVFFASQDFRSLFKTRDVAVERRHPICLGPLWPSIWRSGEDIGDHNVVNNDDKLSTTEAMTMIVDKGSDDNDKIKLTARSDLLPHSRCLLVRIWAKICFIVYQLT